MKTILPQIERAMDEVRSEIDAALMNPAILDFHQGASRNDAIAISLAYLGRAVDKTVRNESLDPRVMLARAAAIIAVAMAAEDQGDA